MRVQLLWPAMMGGLVAGCVWSGIVYLESQLTSGCDAMPCSGSGLARQGWITCSTFYFEQDFHFFSQHNKICRSMSVSLGSDMFNHCRI